MRYLFPLLLLIAALTVHAQDKYPNPEYANHPYFFDKNTKQLMALEKSSAKMSTKVKALGYGGMTSQYVIEGNTSSVNLPVADTTEFVVTGGNMMMDPSQMFSLYLLDANKRQRSAVMAQGKGLLGKNKQAEKISCLLKKVNDKYVLVVPAKLEPGQYAFINTMPAGGTGMDQTFDAYCFAVRE
jgi:hypothetical protein